MTHSHNDLDLKLKIFPRSERRGKKTSCVYTHILIHNAPLWIDELQNFTGDLTVNFVNIFQKITLHQSNGNGKEGSCKECAVNSLK